MDEVLKMQLKIQLASKQIINLNICKTNLFKVLFEWVRVISKRSTWLEKSSNSRDCHVIGCSNILAQSRDHNTVVYISRTYVSLTMSNMRP